MRKIEPGRNHTEMSSPQREAVPDMLDRYVMMVTESLCSLEQKMPQLMQQREVRSIRSRILASLDTLDQLISAYRVSILSDLEDSSAHPIRSG